eukprot:Platyproteum_vivax@DN7221_c1_g1_i2.p1
MHLLFLVVIVGALEMGFENTAEAHRFVSKHLAHGKSAPENSGQADVPPITESDLKDIFAGWKHCKPRSKPKAPAERPSKEFPCPKCSRSYSLYDALKAHVKQRHEDYPLGPKPQGTAKRVRKKNQCPQCGKEPKTDIKHHMRTVHQKEELKILDDLITITNDSDSKSVYCCSLCKTTAKRRCDISRHMTTMHKDDIQMQQEKRLKEEETRKLEEEKREREKETRKLEEERLKEEQLQIELENLKEEEKNILQQMQTLSQPTEDDDVFNVVEDQLPLKHNIFSEQVERRKQEQALKRIEIKAETRKYKEEEAYLKNMQTPKEEENPDLEDVSPVVTMGHASSTAPGPVWQPGSEMPATPPIPKRVRTKRLCPDCGESFHHLNRHMKTMHKDTWRQLLSASVASDSSSNQVTQLVEDQASPKHNQFDPKELV